MAIYFYTADELFTQLQYIFYGVCVGLLCLGSLLNFATATVIGKMIAV